MAHLNARISMNLLTHAHQGFPWRETEVRLASKQAQEVREHGQRDRHTVAIGDTGI